MTRLVRLLLVLTACGGSPPTLRNTKPPQPPAHRAGPAQRLADAMSDRGLVPIRLAGVRRDMDASSGAAITARGGTVIVTETAGWNGAPTTFARRASDGAIVIVRGTVTTIVDRKVPAGCPTFAGGRAWFERVEYQLPPDDRYGGVVEVAYVQHVDQPVYADRQADGSPCPPPMID